MARITAALILMLSINVVLFLLQTAVTDINPAGTQFFNYASSPISNYDTGNYTLTTDIAGQLPQGQSSVGISDSGFFTDLFTTVRAWFFSIPGVPILVGIVSAVPNFLQALQLHEAFTFAVSALWYVTGIFLVVAFWLGRAD